VSDRGALTHTGYRDRRLRVLARDDTCIWCGHPGADAIDHVMPVSRGGSETDPDNMAPIHGNAGCAMCGVKCNGVKGTSLLTERAPQVQSRDWWT
jgi:5-methylcytosine-specific restriction endonuclease McrA